MIARNPKKRLRIVSDVGMTYTPRRKLGRTRFISIAASSTGAMLCKRGSVGNPVRVSFNFSVGGSGDRVLRFVGTNPVGHLVLQVELPLLQRLLFELFLGTDLVLGGELVESRLA